MFMVAALTGEIFIPVFYRLGISSTYEVRKLKTRNEQVTFLLRFI